MHIHPFFKNSRVDSGDKNTTKSSDCSFWGNAKGQAMNRIPTDCGLIGIQLNHCSSYPKKVDLRVYQIFTRSNDMNRFDLLKPLKLCFHVHE